MVCCVFIIYLLFSPIGLVNGLSAAFWPSVGVLLVTNALLCWLSVKYWYKKYAQSLNYGPIENQ
jgi:SSS family solute:Na+ symporter